MFIWVYIFANFNVKGMLEINNYIDFFFFLIDYRLNGYGELWQHGLDAVVINNLNFEIFNDSYICVSKEDIFLI